MALLYDKQAKRAQHESSHKTRARFACQRTTAGLVFWRRYEMSCGRRSSQSAKESVGMKYVVAPGPAFMLWAGSRLPP